MKNGRWLGLLFCSALALSVGGCGKQGGLGSNTFISAREIRPPQQKIYIGSLYYARESPTADLNNPVALEPLCVIDPVQYGIKLLPPNQVADFDLLSNLAASSTLDAINSELVTLGLNGSVSSYFELKLTNVKKIGLSRDDAENLFAKLRSGPRCGNWFENVNQQFAIYQVESIYIGDLSFSWKQGVEFNAAVSAKLRVVEPKLQAALRRELQVGLSGKQLVFAFVPINRN